MSYRRKGDGAQNQMPPKQQNLVQTSFRIPEEDRIWVQQYALRNKTTMQELITGFIQDLKKKEENSF